MTRIVQLAAWEGAILLAGFFGVLFWKLMTGSISLDCLLYGDARDGTAPAAMLTFFSPGRAQLLMFTVVAAGYFLLQVIHDPTRFPQVPDPLIKTLGGSQVVYLAGKAQALFVGRIRDLVDRRMQ